MVPLAYCPYLGQFYWRKISTAAQHEPFTTTPADSPAAYSKCVSFGVQVCFSVCNIVAMKRSLSSASSHWLIVLRLLPAANSRCCCWCQNVSRAATVTATSTAIGIQNLPPTPSPRRTLQPTTPPSQEQCPHQLKKPERGNANGNFSERIRLRILWPSCHTHHSQHSHPPHPPPTPL